MPGTAEAPTIGIVIPTLGRETLTQTLNSVMPQVRSGDVVVVVFDSSNWERYRSARYHCDRASKQSPVQDSWFTFAVCRPNEEGRGYQQRQAAIRYLRLRTDLISFLDDDDIYTDGALQAIREQASLEVPTIFKMDHPELGVLWYDQDIRFGNVGTPMFVVPNRYKDIGTWKAHTQINGVYVGGDYEFIKETAEKMGGVEWRDHVVCQVSPNIPSGERASTFSI